MLVLISWLIQLIKTFYIELGQNHFLIKQKALRLLEMSLYCELLSKNALKSSYVGINSTKLVQDQRIPQNILRGQMALKSDNKKRGRTTGVGKRSQSFVMSRSKFLKCANLIYTVHIIYSVASICQSFCCHTLGGQVLVNKSQVHYGQFWELSSQKSNLNSSFSTILLHLK